MNDDEKEFKATTEASIKNIDAKMEATPDWIEHWKIYKQGVSLNESPFFHDDAEVKRELESRLFLSLYQEKCFKTFDTGSKFYRVQPGHCELSFSRLTSPPTEFSTQPNRFSSAGVSMFYGAIDKETATKEVRLNGRDPYTYGCFKPRRPLILVDLSRFQTYRKIEDDAFECDGKIIEFLQEFTKEVSKPLIEGEDYTPTQAMCWSIEHNLTSVIKHEYTHPSDKTSSGCLVGLESIDGICYNSSITGMLCYVLFYDNKSSHEVLELIEAKHDYN